MQYKIITSWDMDELSRNVNDMLGKGWEPQGGVVCHDDGYSQAIVRKDLTSTGGSGVTREKPTYDDSGWGGWYDPDKW